MINKRCLLRRKKGFIHLSKTNIFIKTKQDVDNIRYVKIVPKGNHFLIIVGYSVKEIDLLGDNSRYGSIDLGLNNLITFSVYNEWFSNIR